MCSRGQPGCAGASGWIAWMDAGVPCPVGDHGRRGFAHEETMDNRRKSIRNLILVKNLTILEISLLANLIEIRHFQNKNRFWQQSESDYFVLPMCVN